MATTLKSRSMPSPTGPEEPRRAGISFVLFVLVAACFGVAVRLPATMQSARVLRAMDAESGVLPVACVSLLKDEQCWLRSVGNDEHHVQQAIANERAVYERWHEPADACRTEAEFKTSMFEAAGCAGADEDSRPLPLAARFDCPIGSFFFVRQDGRVSGCRSTCTVSEDCGEGSMCSSVGSAAGGPIQEPFCE
jgi:hypothetical protein